MQKPQECLPYFNIIDLRKLPTWPLHDLREKNPLNLRFHFTSYKSFANNLEERDVWWYYRRLFWCFLLNGGPFLTTWHIGGSSNFPISVAHKMFKPKPAMHPNEFPRICYVRPIFRLCYVLEKIVCKECLLPAAASAADALCHFPKYSASKEKEKNCWENHEF